MTDARPRLRAIAALLATLVNTACATTQDPGSAGATAPSNPSSAKSWTAALGAYFRHRFNDLLDVVPVSFGAGPGLYAGIHATQFAIVGLGYQESARAGWPTDPAATGVRCGAWNDTDFGAVVASERDSPGREHEGYRKFVGGAGIKCDGWDLEYFRRHGLDLEVGGHVGYVGARVAVSPTQLFDFLGGWFGFDWLDDDTEPDAREREGH